jgi:hypothetical protein
VHELVDVMIVKVVTEYFHGSRKTYTISVSFITQPTTAALSQENHGTAGTNNDSCGKQHSTNAIHCIG